MVRCLITGCEGFVGSHLADLLVSKGHEVYGTVFEDNKRLDHLKGKIKTFKCDMNDKNMVRTIVEISRPDYVFHLAAQSFVGVSWDNPKLTIETNIIGTLNFLEAIRKLGIDTKTLIVGSSSVYGNVSDKDLPIKETAQLRPTSFYAVSKVGEETLGYMYNRVYGMKTIMVRPFNMTGLRKTGDACADFTKRVVEIEKGINDINTLEVGNLNTTRDFTDGRDAVKGLWVLAEKGIYGEVYNLCSGKGYVMNDILNTIISLSNHHSNIDVKQVKWKLRPYDDPIYVGDNSKLKSLGWKPEISIDKTLTDMLDYWRKTL